MRTNGITPGQMIAESIKAAGLQQKAAASVARIDPATLSRVIRGIKPVDAAMALKLHAAFGLEPLSLLFAQAQMDLDRAELAPDEAAEIAEARGLYSLVPVHEMAARGWLGNVRDVNCADEVRQGLKDFFQVDDLADVKKRIVHSARKTDEYSLVTPSQTAWVGRARQVASGMKNVAAYRDSSSRDLLSQLRSLAQRTEDACKAAPLLRSCGIRLVFVEGLKSSKIDGAALWLDPDRPVVAMSLRFDRIDNFWYILRHELEHVFCGDGRASCGVELDSLSDMKVCEERADASYASFIDPEDRISRYVVESGGHLSNSGVEHLARSLALHAGIVAGRIQFLTRRYSLFRKFQSKVRQEVIAGTIGNVDGWGMKFVP